MLADYQTAPIDARERALFAFLDKVNSDASHEMTQADVAAAKEVGWTDEALYDAITVCALFNFYNKWIDATGVSDMPAAAYAASGERLAATGYLPAGSSVESE